MLQTLRQNLKFTNRKLHTSLCYFQNTEVEKVDHVGWEDKIKFWLRKYEDLYGISKLSEMHETVLEVSTL